MQLQVFDGSGQMLGEWSLSGQGTTTLFAGLGALPAGSTVYFGVTAGNASEAGGTSAGIDYQLWVGRQSATDTSTIVAGTATTGPSSAFVAAGVLPLSAATALGALPSSGSSQAASTAPPNGGGNSRVAVGSPATRSAGPSGGLLSQGDPAPAVPSDFSAAVNKEWDEPMPTATTIRPAGEVERTESSGRAKDPDVLVAVNGPGGFPLLGAVAIGHRRRHPSTFAGDLATTQERADGGLQVVASSAPAEPEIPVTEGDISARSPIIRGRHLEQMADLRSLRRPGSGDGLYPQRRALPTDCRVRFPDLPPGCGRRTGFTTEGSPPEIRVDTRRIVILGPQIALNSQPDAARAAAIHADQVRRTSLIQRGNRPGCEPRQSA